MDYEWDNAKNDSNEAKHGLRFERMDTFDWDFAFLARTDVVDNEQRDLWIGPITPDLCAVVATERGDRIRIISLRLATKVEIKKWRKEFSND